jgi:hypothetical protein
MIGARRWDPCVSHKGAEATGFIADFFRDASRKILLVAGAGFDPRSTSACAAMAVAAGPRTTGAFIREQRPDPQPELLRRAEANSATMRSLVAAGTEVCIDVFAADGAVIGGRAATLAIQKFPLSDFTDVVVDLSALSVGVAYPLVRYFFQRLAAKAAPNLHILVTDEPTTDGAITAIASDRVGTVHGFQGGFGLDKNAKGVKLWLPQLVSGKRSILDRIRSYVDPHEVCPILPFPAIHPRLADELIEHYGEELENTWEVDSRNVLYADQRNPLDLYRTVLRIDDARKRIFETVGGSMVILSPIGSKALAVGALMAAMERDFPVAYVEAIDYRVDFNLMDQRHDEGRELIHVWLMGEAYQP